MDGLKHEGQGIGTEAGALVLRKSAGCKILDEQRRRIAAVISSEVIDRDGEIVSVASLRAAMQDYMKNPVLLAGHCHKLNTGTSPVVGRIVAYEVLGKNVEVVVEFAGTALGLEYWELYRHKYQRAFSIGFRPLASEEQTIGGKRVRVYTAIELFEVSCVAVPANPLALSKGKSRGGDFVRRKRIDREKQRLLADDDAYIDLLETKLDDFLAGDTEGLSAAEIELLAEGRFDEDISMAFYDEGSGHYIIPPDCVCCGDDDLDDDGDGLDLDGLGFDLSGDGRAKGVSGGDDFAAILDGDSGLDDGDGDCSENYEKLLNA